MSRSLNTYMYMQCTYRSRRRGKVTSTHTVPQRKAETARASFCLLLSVVLTTGLCVGPSRRFMSFSSAASQPLTELLHVYVVLTLCAPLCLTLILIGAHHTRRRRRTHHVRTYTPTFSFTLLNRACVVWAGYKTALQSSSYNCKNRALVTESNR